LGHRDPADVLAGIYGMELERLKRLVRSKAGALAVSLKIRAAEAAMPYRHSKMPIKVAMDDERLPILAIIQGAHQMQRIQGVIDEANKLAGMKDITPDDQPIETKGQSNE
jgi:hypothetical protein